MRRPGLVAAVLVGLPAAAFAGERRPPPAPVFPADLDVVNVPATVRYAAGHLIGGLKAEGGGNTALYDSMAVYLSRVAGGTGRKVLVVFTDGDDTTSALSVGELIRLVRSSTVTIYPIAFTGGLQAGSPSALRSRGFLNEVANLTGGQVFRPAASRDLPGIYQRILEELSGQYVLGFVSDNTRRDGKYRKLKVHVRREGLRVRHREGYVRT